jgi:hypothetical protein
MPGRARRDDTLPPVHMIKLTQQREITPYAWVHPDDDRGRASLAHGLDRCGCHHRSGERSGHGRGA